MTWNKLSRAQQNHCRKILTDLRTAGVLESVSQVAKNYQDAVVWQDGEISLAELCQRTGWDLPEPQGPDTAALRDERQRLLVRVAEIDSALAEAGEPVDEPAIEPEPAKAVPAEAAESGVVTVRIPTTGGDDGPEGATTAAVAQAAGRSIRTIQRWCATGRIPATRGNRGWIITN